LNWFRRQGERLMRLGYIRNLRGLRRNARLYLLSVLLSGLGTAVYFLFFNLYVLSMGQPREFLGVLQSLLSAVMLVLAIPAGLLGDRIGRRPAMLLGFVSGMLGLAAFLVSPGRASMLFWTLVQGVGNTLFWINVAPFLMQNSSEEDRAFLFSANSALTMLASFVGSLVAGGMPALFARWLSVGPESAVAYRGALLSGVLLSVLALVPLWMVREARWPGPRTARRFELSGLVRLRAPVLRLLLPNALIGLGAALLIPYMNLFFKEQFLIDDQILGTIFAPRELFTAVATMAAPALALRLGKIRSVAFTEMASLGFLLVIGFVPVLPIVAGAFWLRGALMNMGQPLYSAFAMEQSPPEERATVNSMVEIAWQIGWIIGPTVSAVVQVRAGFAPLFLVTGALYAAGAALTFFFFHDAEEREPAYATQAA
jgi:MFS family permease